jgi:pyruvate dehydrogenase E2 component (dihydrolipoamide acetyltransferase)
MPSVVHMPEVLAGMTEAALVSWHVSPGDEVSIGQPIAEVETEKAVVDFEAEQAGTVAGLLVDIGVPVPVGAPLLVLAGPGETAEQAMAETAGKHAAEATPAPESAPAAHDGTVAMASPGAAQAASASDTVPAPTEGSEDRQPAPVEAPPETPRFPTAAPQTPQRQFVSPLVRRLAREHGLELDGITGTGPGGRIVRRDLDARLADGARPAVAAPPGAPPASAPAPAASAPAAPAARSGDGVYTDVPHTGMRRAIARRLVESKTTVPHFYLEADCRMDALLDLRRTIKAGGLPDAVTPSVNDFVVKAVAGALQDVPEANVAWTPEATRRFSSVSIAVAVAVDAGLVTPVVRDVDKRSLGDISRTLAELVGRAREGRLRQDELEGGSFTVSNLGMYGIPRFAAIINPPHAGILAVGAATRRPVVNDDGIGAATVMTVTLSGDHRVFDGALAARWLQAFQQRIEHPMSILL